MRFVRYTQDDYRWVCDFLIALNRKKKTHINWNWARWEWMYAHPYCDRTRLSSIGLWKEEDTVVGAAIYDMYPGEAFCAALDEHRELLPEILEYAYRNLKDENGLGIAVCDGDGETRELLLRQGYRKAEQTEPILCRDLEQDLSYELPDGFAVREIHFPEDTLAYKTVIWKGFDHGDDPGELERMLKSDAPLPPHLNSALCLALADESGEFAAHCTCWYDARTDYAYVEPVCTIPKYRGQGLGKAVVLETLDRCRKLGAREAFVISDQEFYKKLGFIPYSQYRFYWKA